MNRSLRGDKRIRPIPRCRVSRSSATFARVSALLILFPTAARADSGIPMLAVVWPAAWLLLLLIIPLEALVGVQVLRLSYWAALKVSTRANLISTLVGIPLTWLALMVAEVAFSLLFIALDSVGVRMNGTSQAMEVLGVVISCPWLVPVEHSYHWSIPTAALVLCVPFYFMSVRVEAGAVKEAVKEDGQGDVIRWSRRANAWSYGLIMGGLCILIGYNLAVYGFRMPGPR